LPNLRVDVLQLVQYCVTITYRQIFEGSSKVAIIGVLPHVTVERKYLGRDYKARQ